MREGRKKEASKVKQTIRQSNTAHRIRVLMRDERRKEKRSKQGQTNNKAKQHSTSKTVTFLKNNELPRVGHEPTTLYTLGRAHVHVYLDHHSLIIADMHCINKCVHVYSLAPSACIYT